MNSPVSSNILGTRPSFVTSSVRGILQIQTDESRIYLAARHIVSVSVSTTDNTAEIGTSSGDVFILDSLDDHSIQTILTLMGMHS